MFKSVALLFEASQSRALSYRSTVDKNLANNAVARLYFPNRFNVPVPAKTIGRCAQARLALGEARLKVGFRLVEGRDIESVDTRSSKLEPRFLRHINQEPANAYRRHLLGHSRYLVLVALRSLALFSNLADSPGSRHSGDNHSG
jgi:hypothetical protein